MLKDCACVLVICPLRSLIEDQIKEAVPFLPTPSLLLPNFLAHPRRAPSLARFSFACSISAPPEKGEESAATLAITITDWFAVYLYITVIPSDRVISFRIR